MSNKLSPSSDKPTAPEVPREIAKKYGLHNEEVQASEPVKVAVEQDGELPFEPANPSIDSPETSAVIDELVRDESTQLLDNEPAKTEVSTTKRKSWLRRFFGGWWRNGFLRYTTFLLILGCIVAAAITPSLRYATLNTVGVRSSMSLTIIDRDTNAPVKDAVIKLGSLRTLTDDKGIARFRDLKLGNYRLKVERTAFASYERSITIGWGSNPQGAIALDAVGTTYGLVITDYLSGKPIEGAKAEANEVSGMSNQQGVMQLAVEGGKTTKLSVTVSATGYRSQVVEVEAAAATPKPLVLVPASKAYYVHKANGTYDLYSSDIDGEDKKIILAGTGHETAKLTMVVNNDNTIAALVSTRDNKKDKSGNLLQSLTLVYLDSGRSVTVDTAEQIQLIDWIGDRLVYRTTISGASFDDPQRNRLLAYNLSNNARVQLATSNHLGGVTAVKDYLYYVIGDANSNAPEAGLYRIRSDGMGREKLVEGSVWTSIRTSFDTIALQFPDDWRQLDIGSGKHEVSAAPAIMTSLYFARNKQGNMFAWTMPKGNVHALMVKDEAGNDKTLVEQAGLNQPVRWLNDSALIYRLVTGNEVADYAVSINGGSPRKISDTSPSFGFSQAN